MKTINESNTDQKKVVTTKHLIVTEQNWQEVAQERLIRLPGEDNLEQHCMELLVDTESFRLGTLQSFSLIIGKPKSRKSTFITLLIAEALKG